VSRQWWQETQSVLERGWYEYDGRRVDLADDLEVMRRGTLLHLPGELRRLPFPQGMSDTRIEVTQESTLQAVERCAARANRVAVLNFASARNPGGGVTKGGRGAQEESLARASGLYDALIQCREFYDAHREDPDPFYSDRVIHAPDVPVFRRDDGSWLPSPVFAAFVTAAAPNRRMIERDRPGAAGRITGALSVRARGVLAVAAHHGASHLVLGAWGCGVFGNDPEEVADAFAGHLRGDFSGVFREVVFAIPNGDDATRESFERALY